MTWLQYLKLALAIVKLITEAMDKKPSLTGATESKARANIAKQLDALSAKIKGGG